jgi:hypothetical protein
MASNSVFVSPGVFTSERDLSFVTRQIGVTTLGLAGETVKGPAFQPVFITNYDEFKTFFGGQNPTKFKATGYPQYELPYIAKSYLAQSNQLFVTRVLGFSGYKAGPAWGITLDAALDQSTVTTASTTTFSGFSGNSLITFQVSSGGTLTYQSADPTVQALITQNLLTSQLSFLASADPGDSANIPATYLLTQTGNNFSGASFNLVVTDINPTGATGTTAYTGYSSGVTITLTGTGFTDVEDKIVALLRSRGEYFGTETLTYEVTGSTNASATFVEFASAPTSANIDPLGDFALSGNAFTLSNFNYGLSFDTSKQNYITKVLGRSEKDGKTALFVEEIYQNMFNNDIEAGKVRGINIISLANYDLNNGKPFNDYLQEFSPAVTPYVVSELRGNKVLRLFRIWTISDGNTANEEIKVSITNIKPGDKEFDIEIRRFFDTDANKSVVERFSRLTMNPASNNFIGKRVGTLDGEYSSKSSYILIELDELSDTSDAFPAGFLGYPQRDYNLVANNVVFPNIVYKKTYSEFENKRKAFLGLSNIVGIDQDFFDYKGVPANNLVDIWTGLTKGFHMDINATGATIDGVEIAINNSGGTYSPVFEFEVGCCPFETDFGIQGTEYEKIFARKFTFAPYGGFDGWDVYRDKRTNGDSYLINGLRGQQGLASGVFDEKVLTNGDLGINSDYYAYLEAIYTFSNPEAVNINVFATPGIDTEENTNLIEEAIEMVEQDRADSWYIVTTPDVNSSGEVLTADEVVDRLDGLYDSSYTSTYFPWIQVNDTENNVYIWLPATRDVVRNTALTDNIAFPWFAVAGIQRGNVDAIKARKKLTLAERDTLYAGRVNPIITFASEGIKLWGNKTLQVRESALDRINVRRLLLQARKLISAVSVRLLFEQNDDVVRNQFLSLVNPILDNIRSERGLTDFRVVLNDTPESIDRNELNGQIFIKPTRSLEFISIEFVVTNTGASFDNI